MQSESESDRSGSDDALDPKPKRARQGDTSTPGLGRGASAGAGASAGLGSDEEVFGKWCFGKVDERGEWGRGWIGYVPSEEVFRGVRRGWAGSQGGKAAYNLEKYVPCE